MPAHKPVLDKAAPLEKALARALIQRGGVVLGPSAVRQGPAPHVWLPRGEELCFAASRDI